MRGKINISCYVICWMLISFSNRILSQQLPQYTQWAYHQFALNPSHAGIKNCLDIHSLYRMQWLGFEGAPKSGFLTLSAPISRIRKHAYSPRHGVGGKVEIDNIGQFSTNRVNLAYSAHFNFTPDTRLSLGVYGGFVQFSYSPQNTITILPDPTISKEVNFIKPDATFGAWWNGKNYYFGLVLQNLISSKWDPLGTASKFKFHSMINGGYRLSVDKNVSVLPAFLIKVPPTGPLALDLNLLFDYQNKIGGGIGYRNTDAILFMLNCKIKQQLSVQYSYDFVLSPMRSGTINTHEISLTFSTCKPQDLSATKCSLFE